jgi:phosphoribosyl 1,2-cyclic phosphodiesterase
MGAGVLARKYKMPVYATEGTWSESGSIVGKINEEQIRYINEEKGLEIGDVKIEAIPLSHDALEPVGFRISEGEKSLGIATDSGVYTTRMERALRNVDCLILEANHDPEMLRTGPYPWPLKKRILGDNGHLSNELADKVIAYMAEKGTKRFLLGHLSKENNFPELAYQTVCNALYEKSITAGTDIMLDVVLRDRVGKVIEL